MRNVFLPFPDVETASVLHYSPHFRRYKTSETCPSAYNQKTLSEIYCYTRPPGVVCFISSVPQWKTQPCQQRFCVCAWYCRRLGSCFWMSLRVCVLAVKVCEPDGGCGQKRRIAKVHTTVTLCFLHDKDCLSFPPFALTLIYLPFSPHFPLLPPPLIPPLPLSEVISLPPLPLVSSLCYSAPYLCHPFNFVQFLPHSILLFIFRAPLRSPLLCLRTSLPSSFSFFAPADRQHFSVISLSPSAFFFRALSQIVKYKWAATCHLFWFFPPDIRMFHHKSPSCHSYPTHTHLLARSKTDTPGHIGFLFQNTLYRLVKILIPLFWNTDRKCNCFPSKEVTMCHNF